MTQEVWRMIPEFEGLYEVSNMGRVRSFNRLVRCCKNGAHSRLVKGCVLRLHPNTKGYLRVSLGIRQKFKTREIHRLVALAFIPKILDKRYVNHKNGCKTDNGVENLEWVTKREDNQHAQDMGLNKARFSQKQKEAARRNLNLTPSHRKSYAIRRTG